jgi:hypothetical protein
MTLFLLSGPFPLDYVFLDLKLLLLDSQVRCYRSIFIISFLDSLRLTR